MNRTGIREAKGVVRKLGLKGPVDVEDVADRLGISVAVREFRGQKVQEITIGKYIAVRSDLKYRERRWAIAHGIGHVLLHREGNHVWLHTKQGRSRSQHEREAEAFAHELLVGGRVALHSGMGESIEVAAYFGVPALKVDTHSWPGVE